VSVHWKRFCVRGHDTHKVGRNNNNTCRECHRVTARERRLGRRIPTARSAPEQMFAYEPLRAILVSRGLEGRIDGPARRRWAARGVPLSVVDRLCCKVLLMHPFELYGDEWWALEETG
jgi:hypothetical protein